MAALWRIPWSRGEISFGENQGELEEWKNYMMAFKGYGTLPPTHPVKIRQQQWRSGNIITFVCCYFLSHAFSIFCSGQVLNFNLVLKPVSLSVRFYLLRSDYDVQGVYNKL